VGAEVPVETQPAKSPHKEARMMIFLYIEFGNQCPAGLVFIRKQKFLRVERSLPNGKRSRNVMI